MGYGEESSPYRQSGVSSSSGVIRDCWPSNDGKGNTRPIDAFQGLLEQGEERDRAPSPSAAQRAGEGARSAPLDLIEEHLTDKGSLAQFRPGVCAGSLMKNWAFPPEWQGPVDGSVALVAKVQDFAAGGFEVTVRSLDLGRIARAVEFGGRRGSRVAPEEVDPESAAKSAKRARRKVRHLVKSIGADHLLTLTRRESDPEAFWSAQDWARAWDRMRRLLVRVIGEFPYVCVLESHAKGNYHLHIAWVGKINVNLMRKCWLSIVGGRGAGNVDAQYIKVRSGLDRADRIASYVSKYVGKHFEDGARFNKKRYWASRHTLPEARRFVLRSLKVQDGLAWLLSQLGLSISDFLTTSGWEDVFWFPDGSGAWVNFVPGRRGLSPPPF